MSKQHIIKAASKIPARWELVDYCQKKNIEIVDLIGQPISIKWKKGKRKKLTRFHLDGWNTHPCETCGYHTYMSYRSGGDRKSREVY